MTSQPVFVETCIVSIEDPMFPGVDMWVAQCEYGYWYLSRDKAKAHPMTAVQITEYMSEHKGLEVVGGEHAGTVVQSIEDQITEALTYGMWVELSELLQYEHASKCASVGERKRYGWNMIEGGQPT